MIGIGAHNVSAWKKTNKDANYDYLWVDVLTMILLFPGGRPPKNKLDCSSVHEIYSSERAILGQPKLTLKSERAFICKND